MDQEISYTANEIINSFVEKRRYILEQDPIFKSLVESYSKIKSDYQDNSKLNSEELLKQFQGFRYKSILKNSEISCDFNMLSFLRISEKQHSDILAHLLNPNAGHGQNHLFLNIFLDLLGIERVSDEEHWIVTAERGRIDILLKRVSPHSVIVIENKSNYAADQNHQLYRYWHQEIYKSITERNLPYSYILDPPERYYQLLYLSPEYWKIPNTNTLTKPMNWGNELPCEIPLKAKHLLFDDFISSWLYGCLDRLHPENYRMREFIKQYIEYWN